MTPPVIAFEIAAPETALPAVAPITARAERGALIAAQAEKLWDMQHSDGYIVFELEADCTIPSEYILLRHFLGEIDPRHLTTAEFSNVPGRPAEAASHIDDAIGRLDFNLGHPRWNFVSV